MVSGEYSATSRPAAAAASMATPANLAQLERRLHIERVEDIFDRHFVRLVLDDDFAELGEDAGQAARQRFARRELDRAARQAVELSGGMDLDHAVAGVLSATIDAHDSHVSAVYRGMSGSPSGLGCAVVRARTSI